MAHGSESSVDADGAGTATDGGIDFWHAQPYEGWREAREGGCPVVQAAPSLGAMGGYQVVDWEHGEQVLRDPETFSSAINMAHIGQFMGELLVGLDGADHRQYRNLVAKAFRASQLDHWDTSLVRPLIGALVDELRPKGRGDLVADITTRYPVQVICGIVGVPLEDSEKFANWSVDINTGPLDPERGFAARDAMTEYLRPLVEARRAEPTGDFLSDLVNAEVDGERISDARLYGFLRLLLPAGAETTFRAMGNALAALLSQPGLCERVAADFSLIPKVIEETLRWETSVTMVSRVATKDTEIAGCPIAAGSPVGVIVGAANRDGAHFERPEQFDIDRPPFLHMAFATGPHQCLGMHLARLELRAGLETILSGLPNLRLDPDAPPPLIEGYAFRSPNALPVLFDAS